MTRHEDPDIRRRQIASAILALAETRGSMEISVRDVAAQAGVSTGLVQHYFINRDDMLLFACQFLIELIAERTYQQVSLVHNHEPRALLTSMFTEMLPTNQERRSMVRIWIAMLARAAVQPEMGDFLRTTHEATQVLLESILEHARSQETLAADIDIPFTATRLFATVDGLVSHVLLGHYTEAQARHVISALLDEIFVTSPQTASVQS